MLWTRDAILRFTEAVFADYAGRELTGEEKDQVARKARAVDLDAARVLKKGEPFVVIETDVSRFYQKGTRKWLESTSPMSSTESRSRT